MDEASQESEEHGEDCSICSEKAQVFLGLESALHVFFFFFLLPDPHPRLCKSKTCPTESQKEKPIKKMI